MENIILIGAGPMAIAYAEVLNAMSKTFTVIGRGEESAKKFEEKTKVKVYSGGISSYLEKNTIKSNTFAVIATGTEVLMINLIALIDAGVSKILIEKPAAISIEELLRNEEKLLPYANKIFIAYNRRFYASVIEAERLINEDGGLLSMQFEFTEWAHIIEPLEKAPGVKENWFFANSTHVVDLAFFLAGKPVNWNAFSKTGSLSWHDKCNFAGAGITEKGVLFSYLSNWESAGRWAIELLTKNRRIYLKPLEGLNVQLKGSVSISEHEFDDSLDKEFKPGLYKQVKTFLAEETDDRMCSLHEQLHSGKNIYKKILE